MSLPSLQAPAQGQEQAVCLGPPPAPHHCAPGKGSRPARHAHGCVHTCCDHARVLAGGSFCMAEMPFAASQSSDHERSPSWPMNATPSAWAPGVTPTGLPLGSSPTLLKEEGEGPHSLQVGRGFSKLTKGREITNRRSHSGWSGIRRHSRCSGQLGFSQVTLLMGPVKQSARL